MVEIRGVMTDCPEKLTTGVTLIVTLRIYLLKGAFKAVKDFQPDGPSIHLGINEELESEEERYYHGFFYFISNDCAIVLSKTEKGLLRSY